MAQTINSDLRNDLVAIVKHCRPYRPQITETTVHRTLYVHRVDVNDTVCAIRQRRALGGRKQDEQLHKNVSGSAKQWVFSLLLKQLIGGALNNDFETQTTQRINCPTRCKVGLFRASIRM